MDPSSNYVIKIIFKYLYYPSNMLVIGVASEPKMIDYFADCEEIDTASYQLNKDFYQKLLEEPGFNYLVDSGIVKVIDSDTNSHVEVSSRVRIRKEPLFKDAPIPPHISSLSEMRMYRPEHLSYIKSEPTSPEDCVFCPHLVNTNTPEPRIVHGNLRTISGKEILSMPNLYPFSGNHYVTVFGDHYQDIGEVGYSDLENFFFSTCEIGNELRKKGSKGMWGLINFGREAGASQSHPHAQSGKKPRMPGTLEDREMFAVDYIAYTKNLDPFEEYIKIMRDSPYVIFENDHVFITAPFAPKFPDQVDIIPKQRIRNVVELEDNKDDESKKLLIGSILGVFHALRKRRGVTDLNVVIHQNNFDPNGSHYRLHFHIMPRNKNRLGGLEVGFGMNVVGVDPTLTAKEIREHYNSN